MTNVLGLESGWFQDGQTPWISAHDLCTQLCTAEPAVSIVEMEQFPNYADKRQMLSCIYCGRATETRDHVPSKVLLDAPFPENLPVVPACAHCNQSFSNDEAYFACLIECVLCGSTEPEKLMRPNVRRILQDRQSLRERIQNASFFDQKGGTTFNVEQQRAKNVILKLARGHCAYELNEIERDDPSSFMMLPFTALTQEQRDHFEAVPGGPIGVWPEVGSRSFQRLLIADNAYHMGWLTVQEGRYRYLVQGEAGTVIRIVVSEYLACEVIWV